jgi:hypothetical protein
MKTKTKKTRIAVLCLHLALLTVSGKIHSQSLHNPEGCPVEFEVEEYVGSSWNSLGTYWVNPNGGVQWPSYTLGYTNVRVRIKTIDCDATTSGAGWAYSTTSPTSNSVGCPVGPPTYLTSCNMCGCGDNTVYYLSSTNEFWFN